jgi:hypothetical protein
MPVCVQQGCDNYKVEPIWFMCVILMIELQMERICCFLIEVVVFRCCRIIGSVASAYCKYML